MKTLYFWGNQWEMDALWKNFLLNQQHACDPENCGSNRWLVFLSEWASQQENNRNPCLNEQREGGSLKVPETWEEDADKSGSAFLVIQKLSHLLHKKRCEGEKDLWP